jgi:hypothetical protein
VVAPVPPPTEEAEDQKTATTDAGAEEAPDADEESVRTTLHDFATRVYCAQVREPHATTPGCRLQSIN